MKKLLSVGLAMSVFLINSAFAQNLGVLNSDTKPQDLISAGEVTNYLNSTESNSTNTLLPDNELQPRNDARYNRGRGYGRGYGYNYGYGNYYPYYYPSYYYPYYNHYRHRYYNSNTALETSLAPEHDSNRSTNTQPITDAAHTPMVCFAADAAGTWYANADIALNVSSAQQSANSECLASGGNCSQDLGCALAYK